MHHCLICCPTRQLGSCCHCLGWCLGLVAPMNVLLLSTALHPQAPAWHCQHVEVTDTSTGETWLFPCNTWLGSSSAAAQPSAAAQQTRCEPSKLLLPAANLEGLYKQLQEEQEMQAREQYKVAVYTSGQSPTQGERQSCSLLLRHSPGRLAGRSKAAESG